jgi:hypothetical protein
MTRARQRVRVVARPTRTVRSLKPYALTSQIHPDLSL